MGFSRRLNRLPLWLTAAFALAFSATQVAAQDARRLSKKTRGFDKVEEPAEIDSAPDGPVVVQILSLMDEPLPVTDIELGGIDIEVIDATTGDSRFPEGYTYGAAEYRDMTLTFQPSSRIEPLINWAEEAMLMGAHNYNLGRDIVFTFGDRAGVAGVQYIVFGIPVGFWLGENQSSLTLRPQRVEPTMSSTIGPGEFTLQSEDGMSVAIEIDVDGRVVKLGTARFAGGEPVVEESEASSGSSPYNEPTRGLNSVNELVIEVPSGLDEGILSELMHTVAYHGQDQSAEIRVVFRDPDNSGVSVEYLYGTCRLVSLELGSFHIDRLGEIPMLKATFQPEQLSRIQ